MADNQQVPNPTVEVSTGLRSRIQLDRETTKPFKITIIDDEPTTIKLLRKYLRTAGYEDFVVITESSEAVETIRKEQPDVILLDFSMPEVNGLEILEKLRDDHRLSRIPVLMLTACSEAEVKLKALELGATDFLGKPVDPNELIPRVRNTLVTKAYQDDLARLNACLEERIEEQTAALRKAYADLEGLDRLKNEFMTLVSHELRTPVSCISGFMELLTGELLDTEEERAEALEKVRRQAGRLDQIIKDVESFLQLTAETIEPERNRVDLKTLMEENSRKWEPRMREKDISLQVEAPDSLSVHTDTLLLENSLDRLLDNAVKFTEQGTVTVRLRSQDGWVLLEVQDTGCGIEEGYRDRVLTPLTVAANIIHHQEGRGLGLPIVRRQIELLGGKVEFESGGRDRGATFRLVLPLTEDSRRVVGLSSTRNERSREPNDP